MALELVELVVSALQVKHTVITIDFSHTLDESILFQFGTLFVLFLFQVLCSAY